MAKSLEKPLREALIGNSKLNRLTRANPDLAFIVASVTKEPYEEGLAALEGARRVRYEGDIAETHVYEDVALAHFKRANLDK